MTTLNIVIGILFLIGAAVFIAIGVSAAVGKLPGNSVVGLRVPEVRKHESTWVQAHRVVGPFWILTGFALALGGAFAFISHGWLWVAPVIALVAAVVALSVGGNFGARAAALVDEAIDAQDAEANTPQPAPQPQVNLDALRKAAGKADEQQGGA